MLALSQALADAASQEGCTKCATEAGVRALTTFLKDVHGAKKSGQWTKQEQKAFKQEAKSLFKPMKGEVKAMWKGRGREGVAVA